MAIAELEAKVETLQNNAEVFLREGRVEEVSKIKDQIADISGAIFSLRRSFGRVSFSDALEALHAGKMILRDGWNGKGMFVFRQVPATVPEHVIPNMTSLPESVKAEFFRRGGPIHYLNQLALVKSNNEIHGWVPSVADINANDWIVL